MLKEGYVPIGMQDDLFSAFNNKLVFCPSQNGVSDIYDLCIIFYFKDHLSF